MTVPSLKRSRDHEPKNPPQREAKRKKGSDLPLSRREFDSLCDPAYFARQIIENNRLIYELYSPAQFEAAFPADVTPEDKDRLYAAAKRANLFSWKHLVTDNGRKFLLSIENACRQGNPSLAIALLHSGLPASLDDFKTAMNLNQVEVVVALAQSRHEFPLPFLYQVLVWAHERQLTSVASALMLRPLFFQYLCQKNPTLLEFAVHTLELNPLWQRISEGGTPQINDLFLQGKESKASVLQSQPPFECNALQFATGLNRKRIVIMLMEQVGDATLFVYGQGTLRVDRTLLSDRSPYFQTLFHRGFKEAVKDNFEIKEEQGEAFVNSLIALHTGILIEPKKFFATYIYLAEKYSLLGIRELLEEWAHINELNLDEPEHLEIKGALEQLPLMPKQAAAPLPPFEDEEEACRAMTHSPLPPIDLAAYASKKWWGSTLFALRNDCFELMRWDAARVFCAACRDNQIEIAKSMIERAKATLGLDFFRVDVIAEAANASPELVPLLFEQFPVSASDPQSTQHRRLVVRQAFLACHKEESARLLVELAAIEIDHSCFIHAVEHNWIRLVTELAPRLKDNPDMPDTLNSALNVSKSEKMTKILEQVDLELTGNTPLHRVAKEETMAIFRAKLKTIKDFEALLNCQAFDGCTPLLRTRNESVALYLMNAGADIFLESQQGTILHLACKKTWLKVIDLIFERLKSVTPEKKLTFLNSRNKIGDTPLLLAAGVDTAKKLVAEGANVLVVNQENHSFLHSSIELGFLGLCGLFLDRLKAHPHLTAKQKIALINLSYNRQTAFGYNRQTAFEIAAKESARPGRVAMMALIHKTIMELVLAEAEKDDLAELLKIVNH